MKWDENGRASTGEWEGYNFAFFREIKIQKKNITTKRSSKLQTIFTAARYSKLEIM
jgi:hypothetical protein